MILVVSSPSISGVACVGLVVLAEVLSWGPRVKPLPRRRFESGGTVDVMATVDNTAATGSSAEGSAFADVEGKIKQAIAEAVADRRRQGLPIAVAKGDGVELIP